MPLYIRSEEADALARELAARTGMTITDAVTAALAEKLARTPAPADARDDRLAAIRRLQIEAQTHPVYDPGQPDDILYDADGLPK
ncbi:MAG: type II toxin-antitoxin system VapB family antitoxin [Alphaproteobacteria bacterium]|nr:type II toxin-antitoxin system VapB family antitoxin [Alphaproteobacteria bacterium]